MSDFHNPYNFIPALPRNCEHSELGNSGEALPPAHGKYHADRWSGRIAVTLTTKTPLLIPDAAKLKEKGEKGKEHKTYPLRVGSDGKPCLPATSIKGMLRSSYEAVTNSRLSVFGKHGDRLAYRMAAEGKANQTIYPARVEQTEAGLVLKILQAPDLMGGVGRLGFYQGEAIACEDSQQQPKQGKSVWVRLNPDAERPDQSIVTRIRERINDTPPGAGTWRKGWVYITGRNISHKKYERVFIEPDTKIPEISVTEKLEKMWQTLIMNYQEEHKDKIKERREKGQLPSAYLGDEVGKTAFSRHVYEPGAEVLKDGTFCYVQLNTTLNVKNPSPLTGEHVTALLPVTISRRLYESSPADLLPESLRPAEELSELSPADRVFGWVRQKPGKPKGDPVAYKGNLRIHSVVCDCSKPEDAIHSLGEEGLPLAILGQPKEQQARFYAARDQQGHAYQQRSSREQRKSDKEQTYRGSQNHGLRGRKVYPHHDGLSEDYWQPSSELDNGRYQEYRRLTDEGSNRDSQNRSILAWVKENVVFKFEIDVTNLSSVELGALLWLLQLEDGHYHRLGGGKPLGFGSVQLAIDWQRTDLRTGADWKTFYESLTLSETPEMRSAETLETLVDCFQQAVEEAYSKPFEQVPFIAAFLRCAKGFEDGKPIHYPRVQSQPNPKGEGFEWFVANERPSGKRLSLPELTNDAGLPLNPSN